MSLWYNATRLDVFMEAKQELVIFDIEPEERTEKWMQQLPDRVYKIYREIAEIRTQNDAFALIQENFQKNKVYLHEYFPTIHTVFDDILESYFGRYF